MAEQADLLSELEGAILGLVVKEQPVTAYRVAKAFSLSPVTNLSNSKGSIYPSLRRLHLRNLVSTESAKVGSRDAVCYSITSNGESAFREWLRSSSDIVPLLEDPIRSRLQHFRHLKPSERLAFLRDCEALLIEKKVELKRYLEISEGDFQSLTHDAAISQVDARLGWVRRTIQYFLSHPAA